MKGSFWRSMLIICLVQGFTTAISPYAGMITGGLVGIYIASRLWFVDHPAVWWYDLLFFAVLIGIAIVGASVFAAICSILPFTGITTRACRSLSFERALWLHVSMLCLIGGIFWLSVRFWTWWKLR